MFNISNSSGSLTSDSSGELHVLWHDGNSLGVDGTEVSVLEESNHVGLSSLLKGKDGGRLESKVGLEVGGDFSDESLERKLSDEELGRLLVLSDHSESNSAWSESMGLLDTSTGWDGGLGGLGDHLSWGLGAGSLSSCLLGSCHLKLIRFIIIVLCGPPLFKCNLIVNLRSEWLNFSHLIKSS